MKRSRRRKIKNQILKSMLADNEKKAIIAMSYFNSMLHGHNGEGYSYSVMTDERGLWIGKIDSKGRVTLNKHYKEDNSMFEEI